MDHPLFVRVLQAQGGIADQACSHVGRQGAIGRDVAIEADPFDELHHQIMQIAGLLGVVGNNDVRVRQPGCSLHFPFEPLERGGAGYKRWVDHLQRDQPFHQPMLGFVDRTHAANADQAQDAIARMIAEGLWNLARRRWFGWRSVFAGSKTTGSSFASPDQQRVVRRCRQGIAASRTSRQVRFDRRHFRHGQLPLPIRDQGGGARVCGSRGHGGPEVRNQGSENEGRRLNVMPGANLSEKLRENLALEVGR
jgi:hypothetical protein